MTADHRSGQQVLVCGTNYGRYYLAAVTHRSSRYQLAGILARGSERSVRLARRHDVPLYRAVDELPGSITIACAAMSSSARDVTLALIDRGLHVLCEHPHPTSFIRAALNRAKERGTCFHINGHFPDLPAPRAFIEQCAERWRTRVPRLIEVSVIDRLLYPALDIIAGSAGSPLQLTLEPGRGDPPFALIQGTVSGTRLSARIQTGGESGEVLADSSPGYLLDCRISVTFGTGVLTLMSLAGPVLWSCNLNQITDPAARLWELIPSGGEVTAGQLKEQRILANLTAIDRLVDHVHSGTTPPAQHAQHMLDVSRLWQEIGRLLAQHSPQS